VALAALIEHVIEHNFFYLKVFAAAVPLTQLSNSLPAAL
jgi:hypothetical protein